MAANPRLRGSQYLQANHPSFFKVIVSPFGQGLRIPAVFMRKYGVNLGKNVLLKVPTGASWLAEVVSNDDGTWLRKGWREFAEYYSIKMFHFLVFRYDGDSQFHVIIFDLTAAEIDYPFELNRGGKNGKRSGTCKVGKKDVTRSQAKIPEVDDEEDDNVPIETSDDFPEFKKRKMGDLSSRRMMKENVFCQRKAMNSAERNLRCMRRNREKESCKEARRQSQSYISKVQTVICKEKFISYQRAKAFQSQYPFFICFMQPSYVSAPFVPSFSVRFAKEYLSTKMHFDLTLRVPEGKTWVVKGALGTVSARIGCGWRDFVLENDLRIGDVCVFELVGVKLMNINIYRQPADALNMH